MKLKKLSKSSGPPVFTKAQVFKSSFGWLYACQNGCTNKFVPGASQQLMFKIAESHMAKEHNKELDAWFRSDGIHS
jgi:hypothetical protein